MHWNSALITTLLKLQNHIDLLYSSCINFILVNSNFDVSLSPDVLVVDIVTKEPYIFHWHP